MGAGLAAFGMGLGLLGTAVQARSALQSGDAAYEAGLYNAQAILERGRREAERIRSEGSKALAGQQLVFAKAGVTLEGSPLELLAQNAAEIEKEALNATYAAQSAARLERKAGKATLRSSRAAAAGHILSGLSQAAGTGYRMFGSTPSYAKIGGS